MWLGREGRGGRDSWPIMAAPQLLQSPAPFARDVDVVVIGDAFVDILAPVQVHSESSLISLY